MTDTTIATAGRTYAAMIGLGCDPPPVPDPDVPELVLAVEVVAGFGLAIVGFAVEPGLELGLRLVVEPEFEVGVGLDVVPAAILYQCLKAIRG
jgi:hypothetical protein